jgi:hypothetical protein
MKWLNDFGICNLNAAGLPSGWPDEADDDLARFETHDEPEAVATDPVEVPVTQH